MTENNKYDAKVKKLEKSQVEVSISVPETEVKKAVEKSYQKLAPQVKIEGFRAGKAPKDMILAKIGPALYEEALNQMLPNITVEVLEKEGLTPIDQVRYDIEKFEVEEGLIYKATFSVYPEVKIGNLKKIKVKEEKVKVTDEDVEKVLKEMFEDWKKREEAKQAAGSQEPEKAKEERKEEELNAQEKIEKAAKEGKKEGAILKYSEPTDKWAKEETQLQVETLEELKKKVKEEVQKQKESIAKSDYQNKIMEKAIELTTMEIPAAFVERELDRRLEQYKARISSFGLKFDDFLRVQKTSVEQLKDGWRDNAHAFIQSELFLAQLAKNESIEVSDEEIQKQIDSVTDEKTKDQFNNPEGKAYVYTVLSRQKTFKRLMEIVEGK